MSETVVDGALDLVLGGACVGCGRAGRLLCPGCFVELPGGAVPVWPDPVPAGLVEPWAAAAYEGTVRAMVLGLKERRLLGLAGPLARLLAAAVACELPRGSPLVLVPVPSRPSAVRARGHDPTRTLTAGAAGLLRRDGLRVEARRLLRLRRGVLDQAGLDASQRAANLAGAMHCPAAGVRLVSRYGPVRAVLCDDVLTTGSTAREAQRALEEAGLGVVRVAVAAATRRRSSSGS
jgi:predicted amidophosphoribosyltransferase